MALPFRAMELVVHNTASDVADAAARRIIEVTPDNGTVGLAGGSTPAATYRVVRALDRNWSQVNFWLSDERWVPPDHERSNGRMAVAEFTSHISGTLHRPVWGDDADAAASSYEKTLDKLWIGERPDLVLLGIGDDGHTASLFPDTSGLDVRDRWIAPNYVDVQEEMRITATYPLLWAARHVIFLVVGEGKAEALRDSFQGLTPAGRVGDGEAKVEWHVDTAAASLVS